MNPTIVLSRVKKEEKKKNRNRNRFFLITRFRNILSQKKYSSQKIKQNVEKNNVKSLL